MTHLMGLWDLALAYGISSTQHIALPMGLAGLKNDPARTKEPASTLGFEAQ